MGKKQFKLVAILIIFVIAGISGLLFFYRNLTNTKRNLTNTIDELSAAEITLKWHKDRNQELSDSILSLNKHLDDSMVRCAELGISLENISELQPFIFKDGNFNFSTGEYSFRYYGLKEITVKLEVRAHRTSSSGEWFSTSKDMHVKSGDNKEDIYINDLLDAGLWYSFEIWVGGKIIGGSKH